MAASATRRSADRPRVVAVAASGGRDSTALLHAVVRAARPLGVQVVTLHVHHGLQPQADRWLEHVQAQCRRWARDGASVRFVATRLAGRPAAGDSVEAWARRERYAALGAMAREAGASVVLLAHHRRDQAETFLLQALRGGGAAGLAAMPACVQRDGLTWARPWLDHDAAAIDAYLRRHRLRPVDDPSNADPAYARSRLRRQVMPALRAAFDGAEAALAAAARQAQWAQACLDEVARADLATLGDAAAELPVAAWQALTPGRRRNVLQAWLRTQLGRGAPLTLVERVEREAVATTAARWPLPGGDELVLHRGRLRVVVRRPAVETPAVVALSIEAAGHHPVPGWGGSLHVDAVEQGGIALERLRQLELRPRTGGEQFQATPGGVPRSLKKQYQSAGVTAVERTGPLVYVGGRLAFVPGLGLDARVRAAPGEAQATLRWQSDAGVPPVSGRSKPGR